jgi:hypothetical protein
MDRAVSKLKKLRIIAIVAIVALVAIGGYVIYNGRQAKENKASDTPVASAPENNEQEDSEQPKPEPTTKTYTDEKLEGMTFAYPRSWKVESRPTNDDTNIHTVYIDASNTKFDEKSKYATITSGARFSITKSNPTKIGAPATLAEFKKSPYFSQLSRNSKDVIVGGQPAIARDTLYEGPLTYTVTVFLGGRQYDIMTQKELYEKHKKEFEDIVKSIKFN